MSGRLLKIENVLRQKKKSELESWAQKSVKSETPPAAVLVAEMQGHWLNHHLLPLLGILQAMSSIVS